MKSVLRTIRVALLWVFDRTSETILGWRQKAAGTQASRRYEYGFIFTSDIGDAVLFSMFLLVFSKRMGGRCLVITSETNARLLQPFFPGIDFLTLDYSRYKANLTYRFRKIREVMSVALDRCIVPMRSRDYCLTDSIARLVRKEDVLAFESDESNRNGLEAYFERFVYGERLGGFTVRTHELLTYKMLLDRFGVDFRDELEKALPVFREKAREMVISLPRMPKDYVLMNVGASQLYKRWPIEKFIALAERIHAELGLASIFVGGPSEKELQGTFGAYPFIVDLVMQTGSFDVLRSIIVNASAVVSNDTFASHYSTVLGVTTISIAGGGHSGRFLPYPGDAFPMFSNLCTISRQWPCINCGWVCTRLPEGASDNFPCIGEIGVDEVFAMLKKIDGQQAELLKVPNSRQAAPSLPAPLPLAGEGCAAARERVVLYPETRKHQQ